MNRELDLAMGLTAGHTVNYLHRLDTAEAFLEARARVCERLVCELPGMPWWARNLFRLQNIRDAQRLIRQERAAYLAVTAHGMINRPATPHVLAAVNG